MEINKIEDTFYSAKLPNKTELQVKAFRTDGTHIHGRAMWSSFHWDTQILIKATIEGLDENNNVQTPFGPMPALKVLQEKEFEMSVRQYFGLIMKFYQHGPDYFEMI